MRNYIFFIITFVVLVNSSVCQTPEIDSLKNLIASQSNTDIEKANSLNELAQLLVGRDNDEAIKYAKLGEELGKKLNFNKGISGGLYIQGAAYLRKGDNQSAAEYGQKSYQIAIGNEHIDAKKFALSALNLYALAEKNQGNVSKAIELFVEYLKLSEELKYERSIIVGGINLGNLLMSQKDTLNARKHYLRSIEILEAKPFANYLTSAYIAVSGTEKEVSKKEEYLQKALVLAEESNDIFNLGYGYKTMGYFYFIEKEDYRKAISYYEKALALAEKANNKRNYRNIKTLLAAVYGKMGNHKTVLDILLPLIPELEADKNISTLEETYYRSARSLAATNQFESAYQNMLSYSSLKDSTANEYLTKAISEANAKYETVQQEKEIAAQKLEIERQKNARNRAIGSGVALLLLASAIFQYFNFRSRRKKREAEIALELKNQEAEKLKELDILKSRFFTNISHELRTPLTLIAGPLEKVLEDGTGNPSVSKHIELAKSNTKKLLNMVNEIMDLSKLESGKLELKKTVQPVIQNLKRMFFGFDSLVKIKGVELKFESEINDQLWAKIDLDKFEKIITNLVSNAVKFTEAGGSVTMKVRKVDEASTVIEIADTGIGIPEKDLPFVFDRFYQSTSQNEPLQGGTGVGLALARELARLFGGDLSVKSTVGEGSTFSFLLPIEKADAPVVSDLETKLDSDTSSSEIKDINYQPILLNGEKPKVLVVEDNAEMGEYLSGILKENYRVTIAPNGVEALKKLQTESFDLITSDVMMPVMDGFELREKVNQIDRVKRLPFIFITARAMEEDKLYGLTLGVDDYVTKPFSAKELAARIHNLLKNKVERDAWISANSEGMPIGDLSDSKDEEILKNAERAVLKNLSNLKFKTGDLSAELHMSERQLRRVLKPLTGLSPVEFILEIRLQKARQLLEQKRFSTVSEVMFEIGIESASYFSKKFTERFGVNPKEV